MEIITASLLGLVFAAPAFTVLFLSGVQFWPAFFASWLFFLLVFGLTLLVACGVDLVGTARRSR